MNYRELNKCKTLGLKKAKGIFVTLIKLTIEAILDLQWQINNLFTVSKKLQGPDSTNLYTMMHQYIGGEHTLKEFQQENHGLTQK